MAGHSAKRVFALDVPAIYVFAAPTKGKTWMPGTRPGMTSQNVAPACFNMFSASRCSLAPKNREGCVHNPCIRHGRACPGHLRLAAPTKVRRGCPAQGSTRPGMTVRVHGARSAPKQPIQFSKSPEDARSHSRSASAPEACGSPCSSEARRAQGMPGARCTRGLVCRLR